MTRMKIKLLLAIIIVAGVMQSFNASRAQAQVYYWGWRPAPIRRSLAVAAAPLVATWRVYSRAWHVAYAPRVVSYYGYCVRCRPVLTVACNSPAGLAPDVGALVINVPDSATVTVNGAATRSSGEVRRYYSRGLEQGKKYKYEVRVERQVDGTTQAETKTVFLTGGSRSELDFDVSSTAIKQVSARPLETLLTLNVPSDANVKLAGVETASTGNQRIYRTTRLRAGQVLRDYKIRATVERDGRRLVEERTITLSAGERRELTIRFSADRLVAN